MASIVEICNVGLQALGVARMAAFPDTVSTNGKEMTFAYEPARVAMLRRHRWNFAKKQAQLAADSTGPAHTFTNYFTWPSDCLRILLPGERANIYGRVGLTSVDVDWEVHGRKIATNWDAPLDLVYIKDVQDPNEMDALFRDATGIHMAIRTCIKLTGSKTLLAELRDQFKVLIAEAKAVNAIENIAQEIPEDDWVTIRG